MADEETLAAKALSERATVGDDDVRTIIDTLMGIIRHPNANFRSKTAAARVLVQYKRLNLEAIKTTSAVEWADVQDRLDAIEERNAQGDGN